MSSTSRRLYLDYNATSPFSQSVLKLLREGDCLFGNPASLHYTGKYANRFMRETREYINSLFDSDQLYRIIFHSGATEGINFFFRSMILKFYTENVRPLFIFSAVDHSAAYNLRPLLESLGFPVWQLSVDRNGQFDLAEIEDAIEKYGVKNASYPAVMNYLFVNNETGVYWPLDKAQYLRDKFGIAVHVDAVQSVGKVKNWRELVELDCYTYSCHKFGSLKGVGFSLLNHRLQLAPFLYGGGQQEGLRSGTENVLGIYSSKKALEDLLAKENFKQASKYKLQLINRLKQLAHVELLGPLREVDAVNTVMLAVPGRDANTLLTVFDLAKIDVSSGSACAAGLSQPNRILLNMGYSEDIARSSLRLSWDPFLYSAIEWNEVIDRVEANLQRFA